MTAVIQTVTFYILLLAAGLSLVRLIKGPHPVDRIICLDLLALSVAGMLAVHAVRFQQESFLDAVLIISLVAFLGTIVFARLIETYTSQKEGGK